MAYGEIVSGVRAEFREFRFKESLLRVRHSVDVIHISRNRVLILFPRGKAPMLKSLSAKRISLIAPGGRDLVQAWKEPLGFASDVPHLEPMSPRKG